eukprot:520305_1
MSSTLELLDGLITKVSICCDVANEITIDNDIGFEEINLPHKLFNITPYRLLSYDNNKTFIIFGTATINKCYIYDTVNNRLNLISLENEFPSVFEGIDKYNKHQVVNISNEEKTNENTFLMFGNNGKDEENSNFFIQAKYDVNKNSIKFIDLQQTKFTGHNIPQFNYKCHVFNMYEKNQILLVGPNFVGCGPYDVYIYDYMQNNFAKYKIDHLNDKICLFEGMIHKTKKNKIVKDHFIVFGGDNCYEMILKHKNDIKSYSFEFKKLKWITDNKNINLPEEYKNFKEWHNFSYVAYNDFIICFGGRIDNEKTGEYDTINTIYLYDMKNNIWYDADSSIYLLPDLIYKSTAILQIDQGNSFVHILGGLKEIDDKDYKTNNHWKLYLGYPQTAKQEIWNIFKQNKLFSTAIWKIIFDFMDTG